MYVMTIYILSITHTWRFCIFLKMTPRLFIALLLYCILLISLDVDVVVELMVCDTVNVCPKACFFCENTNYE